MARAITIATAGGLPARQLLDRLRPKTGRAFRIAVAGPGGVGKSSLIREIVRRLGQRGERVAIIASDPASPISGGAFLGDRFRMGSALDGQRIFFRSLAHHASSRRSAPTAQAAAAVLDAAGFPWILMETVGTGQGEIRAMDGAHLKILVHSSDGGDEIQMLKAGLAEVADLHVVSKCDRPGGAAWAAELEAALGGPRSSAPAVFTASAFSGDGVEALVQELESRRQAREQPAKGYVR